MPNGLRSKLSKLRFQGKITQDEYKELTEKLEGHDEAITEQIKWERDTAIEQLEQLGYGLGEKVKPCEDCVSRKELLSRIDAERRHLLDIGMDGAEHIIVHHARRIIEDIPSVTPQQRVYDCDFGQEQFEKRRFLNEYLRKWLSSFNANSATVCFTEVQELKKRLEGEEC